MVNAQVFYGVPLLRLLILVSSPSSPIFFRRRQEFALNTHSHYQSFGSWLTRMPRDMEWASVLVSQPISTLSSSFNSYCLSSSFKSPVSATSSTRFPDGLWVLFLAPLRLLEFAIGRLCGPRHLENCLGHQAFS